MTQKAWKKYLTEDEYNSLTPEEVEWAMQEASKQMKTPEGQAALEKARKDRGFKIKLLGTEDWDEK